LFVFRTRETLLAILIGRLFIDIFDTSTIAAAGLLDVTRGLTQLLYLIPVSLIIYYLIKVGGKKE